MAENINPKYDKFLVPLQEVTTLTEALLDGAFGQLMGDQREELKRVYSSVWALRTLFMDVVSNLGIEHIARREYLRERFEGYLYPLVHIPQTLLSGMDGPLDDEQAVGVQFIGDMGERLQGYVAQLWFYSQLASGRCEFQPRTLTLDRVIIPDDWPVTIADVDLELQLPERVPSITGDARLLRQMFRQIVTNAVQHTTSGYIRITVNTYADRVAISITDTGDGIAPQHLGHVFKPFYQADDRESGLGLGLAIARSICTMHGAKVDCQPHPHGTDVTVIFNIS